MKAGQLKNVVLFLASGIFCLLLLEAALRIYGYRYDPMQAFRGQREMILHPSAHPILKYELTPGATARVWGTRVTINSHGFRGPEPTPGKFRGYRILLLGDSIVFGNRISFKTTFPYKLQHLLDPERERFEVLNFGVGGYDTLQEVALLQHRGLRYQPDLVVLTYCLNDIGIVSINMKFKQDQELNRRYRRLKEVRGWANHPLYRLRLAQLVASRMERLRQQEWTAQRNDPEVFRTEYQHYIEPIRDEDTELLALMGNVPDVYPSLWYGDRDRVGRLRFAFKWLKALSLKHDFQVLVIIVPWLESEAQGYPHETAHRIVRLEAQRAGFETIDFTSQFMESGIEMLRLRPEDLVHPNDTGHTMIAEELSKYVLSNVKEEKSRSRIFRKAQTDVAVRAGGDDGQNKN